MKVNVVAVQVVRNVRALARPGTESLELVLWLAHVRVEVRESAQGRDAIARVDVNGIEALVNLDGDQDVVLHSSARQRAMLLPPVRAMQG